MRLSTKGQYAVRAMVVVALHDSTGPVPLRYIAEIEDISEQYLEQIFMDLRKDDLVTGLRGARGGYVLNRPAEEITSGDIVRAVEGPIVLVDCDHDGACQRAHVCATRALWARVSESMSQVLDGTTLADLANWAREKSR
ncbi:MAG: BadM/Rrf2 family transcriptional regulator [Bacillota bacterium]|nr:MAG: BadM/Rrf2 family transcriptional regulator [Bacillota bacterium]MBS3950412.1 Rrf2 family transcriptional regulator [Peptococcaceae bacterium]